MLKIENINVGDKLYCVKNFVMYYNISNKEREIFLNGRYVKDLSTKEKTQYRKIPSVILTEQKILINGNTYKVLTKIADEITISTEDKNILITQKTEKNFDFNQDEIFLDEYFITEIEGRKIKFDSLSDNNFNSFLKKLKK
jgi:uncharacterized membrane-anchored protein